MHTFSEKKKVTTSTAFDSDSGMKLCKSTLEVISAY